MTLVFRKLLLPFLLSILLLHSPLNGKAQVSDSLYTALPQKYRPKNQHNVTLAEMRTIIDTAINFIPATFHSEARFCAAWLDKQAEGSADLQEKITTWWAIGDFYTTIDDFKSSIPYYQKMVQYAETGKSGPLQYLLKRGLLDCSYAYLHLYKLDSAVKYVYKTLDMLKADQPLDTHLLADVYSRLYEIYLFGNHLPKALEFALMAQQLVTNQQSDQAINIRFNIVVCYFKLFEQFNLPQYADAAQWQLDTIRQINNNKELWITSKLHYRYGVLEFLRKNYTAAIRQLDSSLLNKYNPFNYYAYGMGTAKIFYRNLCFVNMGDISLGRKMYLAFKDDHSMPSDFYIRLSLYKQLCRGLYEVTRDRHLWKESLLYYQQYVVATDSLKTLETSAAISDEELKYSMQDKEIALSRLENLNLQKQKQQNKIIAISLAAGLVLLLLIAALYIRNRSVQIRTLKDKQQLSNKLYNLERALQAEGQERVQIMERQRVQIAENMHDEISSSLAALRFLIVDRKLQFTGTPMGHILQELEGEAQAVYQHTRDFMHNLKINGIAVNNNVVELIKHLTATFENSGTLRISSSIDAEAIAETFTTDMHQELYLVFKEAITNCIKYSGADSIEVKLWFDNDYCYFSVADNGKGFSVTEQQNGIGLVSMQNRVSRLGGRLGIVSSKSGTLIEGMFPVY